MPALEGCYSQGETLEEAIAMIREAITLYLDKAEGFHSFSSVHSVPHDSDDMVILIPSGK